MDESATKYEAFGSLELKDACTTHYARKKGRSHVINGTVCQDYCLVENIDSETQVVCVADGHGGDDYVKSDVGSRLACEIFYDFIKKIKKDHEEKVGGTWLDVLRTRDFKDGYIQLWKDAVIKDYLSSNENCNETENSIVKKYGTTFLFAVYSDSQIAVGQLGDGAILLFNDYNQGQLFKRHKRKTSSRTSSLASSRAQYAFVTDVYNCNQFSYVLLSTDGIYDKLDKEGSFLIYANSLVQQINVDKKLNEPFCVNDTDVSEISKDDCTIAMIDFEKKSQIYDVSDISMFGYEDIKFKRGLKGIEIYEAKKDGTLYEIHILQSGIENSEIELKSCTIIKESARILMADGRTVYPYQIPDNWLRIRELIECGEHLEKKYFFNDNDDESESSESESVIKLNECSNEYWLDVYEKMMRVKEEFDTMNAALYDYAFECAFITEEKEIVFLSDSLYDAKTEDEMSGFVFNNGFFGYLSIIGKITCGEISIPLFECASHGQNIVMLHALPQRKSLCRVVFNRDKKMFGLWNITSGAWIVENKARRELLSKGVLRLTKNNVFFVQCDEIETIQGAEIVDGYAKYQVNVFFRRMANEKG